MRSLSISWFLVFLCFSVFFIVDNVSVYSQCLEEQSSLLLQLKHSLSISPSPVTSKLASWNSSTDCCSWEGVTCHGDTGHVIGLDLSGESISGGIDKSSSLFHLKHLQSLNLAYNSFKSTQIPSGCDQLLSLTALNLSNSGFSGQIPSGISRLTMLVSLDLSILSPKQPLLELEHPKLRTLVHNLTELRILRLDRVHISAQGSEWCQALSSALPNLQVLSLSNCFLSGPIDSSLLNLGFLSEINLDQNNISSEVSQFFVNFLNLTSLHLSSCGLYGKFPEKILQLTAMKTLDVSSNLQLHGSLPAELSWNGSLQKLVLSHTSFSGYLPESIGNLKFLSKLELGNCSFNGSIPFSIANLTQLVYLGLSYNNFTGIIPLLPENLVYINLSYSRFTGPLRSFQWERLLKLVVMRKPRSMIVCNKEEERK